MEQIIFRDIWTAIKSYFPLAVLSGIIWSAILYVLNIYFVKLVHWKVGINQRKLILIYLFYVYIFFVISITLLSREPGSRIHVNLVLFGTFTNDIYGIAFVVENVLLFIPLGFILPLLCKKFQSAKLCLGTGLIYSLLIETIQYITKRGYFQTDDIIMNFIGTLIGFVMVNVIKIILFRKNK